MPRKPRYLSHNTNNQSLDNKTSTNLHSPWFPFTHPSEIQGQQHLCDNVLSGEASASASTSKPVNDPAPLKVPINSPYTLCIDDYFAQSKNPTRKIKKNHAQGPGTRSNEFVACHKGYNHVNVAPYPQPAQQHSSDSNTELHDSQEVVTHHVASQDLNPSTSCRSSTSNVSLQDEVFQNKRPKKTQHSNFQSTRQVAASVPQKRKQNYVHETHTNNNEVTRCHKGDQYTNVAPYPQPAQQHSSDSNTELHDSQEVLTHHVASQDLNPSTSCRSSTSNVSLQDEVFQNKRPKKTQHSNFQSTRQAAASIPQKRKQNYVHDTDTNNNEVTRCHKGDRYTNVAPDPQPPQQHATTSNTEVHESHQDVDDHFASQNLHPVSCSPSSFDNRLSQNKRQKRTQASSSTSTRRATGGATHNVRLRLRTENLAGTFMSSSTPSMEGPSVLPLPGTCLTFTDLIHFFDTHNELVQVLRAARDLSDQPDVPEFKLRLYNAEGTRGYELPTSNTLAAIVFDSGPASEADFDVIIQYKGGQPQRINKLHKSYMSMQFPLIFIYGQPGFHTGLMSRPAAPNKKPRRVSLNAQMENTASTQQQSTTNDKTLAMITSVQEPTTITSTQLAETTSNEKPLEVAQPSTAL
ncbi:helitron helicase-like domain-containing protein [Artemisia annua]|uniref:Helitron helicase-like domain-containing protein n=1 Tax=Artemisia annua TaxID=35608 RepID=A0A2U1NZ19_ARTAN|nr:helitron helicase-like domain-containing protein [Artemisia annua]